MEKKKAKFFSWQTLLSVIITVILCTILWFTLYGVPLSGLPDEKNVESITLLYGDTTREIDDSEDISRLVNAANLCSYQFGKAEETAPLVTVTYHTKDGKDITLSASSETMWWKGRPHKLKETDLFVNIIEGLYFQNTEN